MFFTCATLLSNLLLRVEFFLFSIVVIGIWLMLPYLCVFLILICGPELPDTHGTVDTDIEAGYSYERGPCCEHEYECASDAKHVFAADI